ncbi:hypothetical protein ACFYYH_05360 [Streptomyces sp. NPDC002018]|uniref:hypothetical protein n=1 Tax=Streptomyces sp. NPDC002018 TaxID=3364629 RepID=UPI0036AE73FE
MTALALRRLLADAGRLLGCYGEYITHAAECSRCSGGRRCSEGEHAWRNFLNARDAREP